MSRIHYALLILLYVTASLFAQRLPDAVPLLTAPIPCNQYSFSIPFEVYSNDTVDPIKEVELLLSKDQGGQWLSVGKKSVTEKKFDYKAEQDGELWFAFRSITLSGKTNQSGNATPIRVLVDASAPVLTLEMKQQDSGEMLVSWKAEDQGIQNRRPDFAVNTVFSAETMEKAAEKKWKPLSVDGRYFQQTATGREGRFLFWPENDVNRLELRAVLTDSAGNRSEKTVLSDIKPVHRDEATRQREANRMAATLTSTRKTGLPPLEPQPLQPPKPVRMTKAPKKSPPLPIATEPVKAVPTTDNNSLKRLPLVQEEELVTEKKGPESTPVTAPVIDTVTSAPQPKTTSPLPSPQPPPPARPGQITGISMASDTTASRPQIIVKWQRGDEAWNGSQVDVMRSTDKSGPWFPVATNLPNNGEYWWYISPEDFRPFYIMLQMRSLRGGVQVDVTKSPIRIDPKSVAK